MFRTFALIALLQCTTFGQTLAFQSASTSTATSASAPLKANISDEESSHDFIDRRSAVAGTAASLLAGVLAAYSNPTPANAADKMFAPGGTLVEYEVGAQVGNSLASPTRKYDNSNVIFNQDYYYKFGTAAPFIEPGSIEFPKTMPFVLSQQRYEALKKYRERVQRGVDLVASLKDSISNGKWSDIPEGTAPEYSIRPMGLLANNFMASENTGTTNELLLARWYINEIYLDIDDIKNAKSKEEASKSYEGCVKAMNSYLGLLNRVTTPKVGDKWDLL